MRESDTNFDSSDTLLNSSFNPLLNLTRYEEYDNWAAQPDLQLHLIYGYSRVILGLLGTIGNSLSLVVLLQPQMRVVSINILLIGLQLSDLFFVIVKTFQAAVHHILEPIYPHQNNNWFNYYQPFFDVFATYLRSAALCSSRYFTVLVTIERYIAVCHPLKAATLLSPKRAVCGSLIATLLSIIFGLPFYFSVRAVRITYNKDYYKYVFTKSEFRQSSFYKLYVVYIWFVILHLLPFVSLIILNTSIGKQMRKSQDTRSSMMRKTTANNDAEKNSLTYLLFAIVITFFVCNIGLAMQSIFIFYNDIIPSGWSFIIPFVHLLLVLNSSVNFIFYCAFGKKFRLELRNLVRRSYLFRLFLCLKNLPQRFKSNETISNTENQTTL